MLLISAGITRGLIEAPTRTADVMGIRKISAGITRGLIEASGGDDLPYLMVDDFRGDNPRPH